MIKVVLIEDEAIIRKSLIVSIDWISLDCSVVGEADSGTEGLALILSVKPDLVITDIRMPGMDGIAMLFEARKSHNFGSIILSSYGEFEYAKRAISLGVTDYILKPIDEEKFTQAVRTAAGEIRLRKRYEQVSEQARPIEEIRFAQLEFYFNRENLNPYVKVCLTAIQERYFQKLNLETLAEELGVSASYLSRKFKEATGVTFLDLLNKYRVQRAVSLLQEKNHRVYQVSDMVGFGDYKNFCTVFRKYAGLAPRDFLKSEQFVKVNHGKKEAQEDGFYGV